MPKAEKPPISCIYHDLHPMTDSDPRAVEGATYEIDGIPVRLTSVNGSWYFEDV